MQTTMLKLAGIPDDSATRTIADVLGAAPGVLAARLSTAGASVAIDYESPQTSPERLRAALAQAGVASEVREAPATALLRRVLRRLRGRRRWQNPRCPHN
ncbi:heavy-metal-associated domain-containing protein [Pseudoduganella chitinolytica]|uniref:HMA domain-containing protein n=1 Tax=Pseudoduganella chitinolytica TaxID=34070 RepID=A0ABY8BEZ5_9BURK|nr:hypothetical protein [Pseudoduganella chitinolytica]WEF34390.1 hypothetical protein PX653_06355 [Pseudoduganella chitinolytica]